MTNNLQITTEKLQTTNKMKNNMNFRHGVYMSQPDLTSIASSPPTYDLCDQGDKVGEPGSHSESLLQFDLEFKTTMGW